MHFCDYAINTVGLSDPFLIILFGLQCCCSCWRARAKLQLAKMMHAISASSLCKIDLSKRECADGIFLAKDIGCDFRPDSDFTCDGKKSNNSEVNLRLFLP